MYPRKEEQKEGMWKLKTKENLTFLPPIPSAFPLVAHLPAANECYRTHGTGLKQMHCIFDLRALKKFDKNVGPKALQNT